MFFLLFLDNFIKENYVLKTIIIYTDFEISQL